MDNDKKKMNLLLVGKKQIENQVPQKEVISFDDLIQIMIKKSKYSEETLSEFFTAFDTIINNLYQDNPEGLKHFFEQRFNAILVEEES